MGAGLVRVVLGWRAIAPPRRPAGFDALNPDAPGYNWTQADAIVRSLAAAHLHVLLALTSAPAWAEGAGSPTGAIPGTWRPDAQDYAEFAYAAAKRYSGHYPDPLRHGHALPRVSDWEAWNEPNLSVYLAPQWNDVGGQYVPESPSIYRSLLNGLYAAVKRVSSHNVVIAGSTAPFGDPPGGSRMHPVTFDQNLLCLTGGRPGSAGCPVAAHFDVLDHHPYGSSPTAHAVDPGDVSVPDMGELGQLLAEARRAHTDAPAGPKQLWATELVWTSKPPDPDGVSPAEQARWLEQSFYILWREGVSTVLWLQIVDDPPGPDALGGGLYFRSGRSKPAATAFRFPFVTSRQSGSVIQAWGHAPLSGRLRIELRTASGWRTLRSQLVGRGETFAQNIPLDGAGTLRAQVGTATSLAWLQG